MNITILHFFVDGNEFVTDATFVDSIIRRSPNVIITKLPQYGDTSTIGVYKYQDKIYQIKDSGMMLGYSSELVERNFILLLSNQTGIMVDSVSMVNSINVNDLTTAPVESKIIKAVYVKDEKVIPFVEC